MIHNLLTTLKYALITFTNLKQHTDKNNMIE